MLSREELVTKVAIRKCSLTKAEVAFGRNLENRAELDMKFSVNITCLEEKGAPTGLRTDVSVEAEDGEVYSLSVAVVVLFDFPDKTKKADMDWYLKNVGSTRAVDAAKLYLKQIAEMTDIGPLSFPSLTVSEALAQQA